jgi:hypothetical protein
MGWHNVAAGLGTGATVQALKAAEGRVSKGKYKRLIATAVKGQGQGGGSG